MTGALGFLVFTLAADYIHEKNVTVTTRCGTWTKLCIFTWTATGKMRICGCADLQSGKMQMLM